MTASRYKEYVKYKMGTLSEGYMDDVCTILQTSSVMLPLPFPVYWLNLPVAPRGSFRRIPELLWIRQGKVINTITHRKRFVLLPALV